MSSKDDRQPTYPGGMTAVLAQMEGRRDAFSYAPGEGLPPVDLDLAPLAAQTVTDPDQDPAEAERPYRSSYHRKRVELRRELTGQSELVFLNALLIAHLRKRAFPPEAPVLFQRLWAEQGAHLLDRLDARWLVSSVTTFGDHGATPTQRAVGLALNVLFGTMKLYETERLYSGLPPDKPFALDSKVASKLPMEMDAYSITAGGLDVNMLGRLWMEAEGDAVIRPLAHHLIDALIHDPASLFRRLMTMRNRKERKLDRKKLKPLTAPVPLVHLQRGPGPRRWGIVTTVKAPLDVIARFAAYHLDLGADALHLYLDAPEPGMADWLSRHPGIRVTECTPDWWQKIGKPRPDAHQLRQAHNATRTLRAVEDDLDWLGHIDVDEFLLPEAPLAELLGRVPPACAVARLHPAEVLAGPALRYFKLTHKAAGHKKAVVQEIYPNFGMHLYGGFLSHSIGKVFVRPGIPETRLGIHALKYRSRDVANEARLEGTYLGHFHATSWEQFRSHLDFRRERGSYRTRIDNDKLRLDDILQFLIDEEGEDGLRAFFDEICADTPELRSRLAARGMLLDHPLDLDAAVMRVFGALP